MPSPDDADWYLEQAIQKAKELPPDDMRAFARELENLAFELFSDAGDMEVYDAEPDK